MRKLLVLIEHLPPESALNTTARSRIPEGSLSRMGGDPAKAPWSSLETMMAMVVDEIRQLGWMYASAHSNSKIPRPEPIKRPGVTGRKPHGKLMDISAIRKLDPRLRGLSDEEVRERMEQIGRRD